MLKGQGNSRSWITGNPEVEIRHHRCQEPTPSFTRQASTPTLMKSHHIHPELLKHKVRVLVVGCGGNGSAVAAGLPYLHQALLACGHPEGLHVTLLDPDAISPTNCVRQAFSQSEIGLYKSVVLANRRNMFWVWIGKAFQNGWILNAGLMV
jgi:tRNA A37 threonylcarbamoyladenosine dehydratase